MIPTRRCACAISISSRVNRLGFFGNMVDLDAVGFETMHARTLVL
jgi:hypothetical protein